MPRVIVTALQALIYEGQSRQPGDRFEMYAIDASMAKRKGLVSLTVRATPTLAKVNGTPPDPIEEPVETPKRRRYRTRHLMAED